MTKRKPGHEELPAEHLPDRYSIRGKGDDPELICSESPTLSVRIVRGLSIPSGTVRKSQPGSILLKLYRVPRTEVAASLEGILTYKGVVNQDLAVLRKALGLFSEKNVDIVDAMVHALAEERGWSCFSFDKDMDKLRRQ